MIRQWTIPSRVVLVVVLSGLAVMTLHARQRDDAGDLRDRLRGQYDIVALQDGVGLMPRLQIPSIRIIEVRGGAVAINGEEVTGRQLREQLGADADMILRVSYMNPDQQRSLATSPARRDGGLRRARRGSDKVRLMGDVTVARDEQVRGDVVALLGSAQIDGEVDGDLTVVIGSASLGAESVVTGDVTVIGGVLNRAPGARVDGSIHDVGFRRTWSAPSMSVIPLQGFFGRLGSLASTLVRITVLALLALVLMAVGRSSIERVADRAAADPWRAGLIGFAAQVLFVPALILTILVLAISIVGIPFLVLIPFGVVLGMILLVIGFTGVAYHVGRLLNERTGATGRGEYLTVLLGVVTIAALTLLARSVALMAGGVLGWPLSAVGYVVEYAAWTLGLGAAILAISRRGKVPPPIPM
jgi:hypothetical protein